MKWLPITTALLLIATLVAPAAEEPKLEREHFALDGRPAFVILPAADSPKHAGGIPWVLYAPSFDRSLPSDRDEGWMMRQFLDKGIAIAGIDVGESYGSPRGQNHYTALYTHLVKQFNFDPKASLLARSRGGLMLYNWAVENPEKVRCIAGIYPVCDLASYPGLAKACSAYDLSAQELEAQLDQHNPIPRLKALADAGVPILHIHGDQDKVVPLDANSAALVERYKKLGGTARLIVAPGQGHNMWRGFFQCQELVDFIISEASGT